MGGNDICQTNLYAIYYIVINMVPRIPVVPIVPTYTYYCIKINFNILKISLRIVQFIKHVNVIIAQFEIYLSDGPPFFKRNPN